MYILGLETSCDESAAAIIQFNLKGDFKILSNIVSSQIKIHSPYGGVVPEIAAREHVSSIIPVIDRAIKKASIESKKITALALTTGPGLITSLIAGSETAKSLAYAWNLPIIPINHIEGHIYSAFLNSKEKIKFPALVLTVSGGHNLLLLIKDHLSYEVLGSTLDDAAGEAFDKAAKMMNLGYPGGPIISQKSKEYQEKNSLIEEIKLPRPMINSNDFNFSFSGLKTALLYQLKKDKNWKKKIPQYSYSFQKAIIDVLVQKTLKAKKKYQCQSVVLVGGVSANQELKKTFQEKLKSESPSKFISPDLKYTGDNAAMIAMAGVYNYLKNKKILKNYKNVKVSSSLKFN